MDNISEILQHTNDTKKVLIGRGVIKRSPELFKDLFGKNRAIIITDSGIEKIAGKLVKKYFSEQNIGLSDPVIFDSHSLNAGMSFVEQLEKHIKNHEGVPVGIGAGVINDLTKLASERVGRPYMIIGTAASMDGYTSFGASIIHNGNKQNFDCKAPKGVVFDADIASKSNPAQSASGYADLLAKITAGADWMIADFMEEDQINDYAFSILRKDLEKYLAHPEKIRQNDPEAIELLATGLMISGFAMQIQRTSRPASGLEHIFSHYWDMTSLTYDGRHVSHGYKVAIGTLIATSCLEFLIEHDFSKTETDEYLKGFKSIEDQEKEIEMLMGESPVLKQRCMEESRQKYKGREQTEIQLEKVRKEWNKFKISLKSQIMPYETVYENLKSAGCPYEPEMIGLTNADLRKAFLCMPYMRNRYTCIDLVYRTGLMGQLERKLFGKGGRWEII